MDIEGLARIESAKRKHADAADWLARWIDVATHAAWKSITDVRRSYPHADGVKIASGAVVTVFNVRGNSYRLLTVISYHRQVVRVLDVLTHAEYDREKWK